MERNTRNGCVTVYDLEGDPLITTDPRGMVRVEDSEAAQQAVADLDEEGKRGDRPCATNNTKQKETKRRIIMLDLKAILADHALHLESEGQQGKKADLAGADLSGQDLSGVNLQRANLQGATLQGADLRGANLQGANLQGATLRDTNLRDTNLQDTTLQGANIQNAFFWESNLQGADLQGANIQGATLRWSNLTGANLQGANIRGAYLECANLQGADLQGADLQGAILIGANLQGATLDGADLEGANLAGANLTGARLMPPADLSAMICQQAREGDPAAKAIVVATAALEAGLEAALEAGGERVERDGDFERFQGESYIVRRDTRNGCVTVRSLEEAPLITTDPRGKVRVENSEAARQAVADLAHKYDQMRSQVQARCDEGR